AGEQKIARGDMAVFKLDAARAVARRLDRRRQSPRPLGIGRTDGHDDTTAMRPLKAQRDVLEVPVLAGARVVDVEVAVLEAELAQIVAVESGLADAVDPRQQRGKDFAGLALRLGRGSGERRTPGRLR